MRVVRSLVVCVVSVATAGFIGPTVGTAESPHRDQFGPRVRTEQGIVVGSKVEGSASIAWLGVPYAAAPVGSLRWQPPEDALPRSALLTTTTYAPHCYQVGDPGSNEDCLYLNVWRPDSQERNLPVLVWIHGGSNTGGSGDGFWYAAAQRLGVVIVSVNYRLGAMGWFLHPALKSGDPEADSGNYGLLDQIKALEWVHDNIRSFGGDPRNVTLAGESAGSQDVSYLMHTKLAAPYFQKAMIESNFPGIRPVSAAYKSSKQVLYNLLVTDGTAPTASAAKTLVAGMGDAEIREYLRGKTAAEITATYRTDWWGSINWGDFYRDDIVAENDFDAPPIVQGTENRPEFVYAIGDGYVLPSDLTFADFSEGHAYPKPLIVGTTRNENNLWNASWPFNFQQGTSLDELVAEAIDGTNPDYGYLQNFYDDFGEGDPATFKQNYTDATSLIDEIDTYLAVTMAARNLAQYAEETPVYAYRFDWGSDPTKDYRIPNEDAWKFYKGSIHGAELDFFYQTFFGLAGSDSVDAYEYTSQNMAGRKALSNAIASYLRAFLHARDGEISRRHGQPATWKPWTATHERYIVFDADYRRADVTMRRSEIPRQPEALKAAYDAMPNSAMKDFIAYYVLWSWHWNWYPNGSVGPFDTSPGPNPLFDPANP